MLDINSFMIKKKTKIEMNNKKHKKRKRTPPLKKNFFNVLPD